MKIFEAVQVKQFLFPNHAPKIFVLPPFLVATDLILLLRGSFRKRFDIQHMDFCHCFTNN